MIEPTHKKSNFQITQKIKAFYERIIWGQEKKHLSWLNFV